jgi:hypothetical protein
VRGQSSDPRAEVIAIGSCFDESDKAELVPKIDPPGSVSVADKMMKEMYEPNGPGIPQLASPRVGIEEAFFLFNNWRIDHRNVSRINISVGGNDQNLDWHSPLRDSRGM